jgi:hypothetical protein
MARLRASGSRHCSDVIRNLVVAPWATGLQPIAATVIDNGQLCDVPTITILSATTMR